VARGVYDATNAGLTLLAPNTELAQALFDRVERQHVAAGHDLWPTPRIRDFSGWLRQVYSERQLQDSALPRCLSDTEERELWRSVVLDSTGGADLLEPHGAAQSGRRARRAMLEFGIPIQKLEDYATDESLALLQWIRRFDERCRELKCISADSLLESMPAALGATPGIAWIESPIWRPVARRWLESNAVALLLPEDVTEPPAYGAPDPLSSSPAYGAADPSSGGTSLKDPPPPLNAHQPPVESGHVTSGDAISGQIISAQVLPPRVVLAPSPAAELAAVAEWARDNLRRAPDFRAWICIPDLNTRRDQVVDAFDAVLAPQRYSLNAEVPAPYAVAGGTPLSRFAPVRAALDTLSAVNGVIAFEQFSALLRMPELQATPHEAGAAAHLDVVLRGRGPSEATLHEWLRLAERLSPDGGARNNVAGAASATPIGSRSHSDSSSGGTSAVAAIRRLRTFLSTLESVRGAHRMSHWVTLWVDAFEAGPWALRQRWSSAEFQAAERCRELLASLATSDALFGAQSGAAAVRLLGRAARDIAFQPQTGIPPIWVSSQIMDPWLAYEGLWVAGCSEQRWPPPLDPIPLLPVKLQRDYGVIPAGIESQLRQAEDLQRRWLLRANACVFSCANQSDGRPTSPSPLLPVTTGADANPDADSAANPDALPLHASSSLSPAQTQPHWRALAAYAPTLAVLDDERAPPFAPDMERTRGVATLRAQSRCAFRGFADTRLRAEPLDRPVPGFNMRERGELLHHALEHVWSELGSSERLTVIAPADLDSLVADSVTRAITRQCEHRDPGARWRRRELPRMTALLGKWLEVEKLREPFFVEQLERGAQAARHGGLDFNVRIDRIDRLRDGGRVLIDYKTGMTTADWRGERPDNPQLPIYALLHPEGLVAVAYGKVNASDCGFVSESARAGVFKPRGRPSALEGMPDFAALVSVWSQRIEKIAAEFAAGHAEVAPTLRACASCSLQPLCRIPAELDDAVVPND
jgi:ATP-dependent helicase/nuclease subunit B